MLIPIRSAGRITSVLAIGTQTSSRFDSLHRQREMVERKNRETLLLQQVTQAELKALRAQINPHFLFNSLNTIADLVVSNPELAETMTLRLSRVFRHLLASSSRTFSSLEEEMDFLKTYLGIEEIRFGDRLQVEISLAREIAGERIPSLILQPLVENALKHGLAPKPGKGHLRISALREEGEIVITVEDDGVGPGSRALWERGRTVRAVTGESRGSGTGLENVARRLATLYQDRASVKLEARTTGGSCVTMRVPQKGVEVNL